MTARTAYTPTVSQEASAQAHFARRDTWVSGHRKSDGRAFWIMPSSNGRGSYYVARDGSACTCEGSRRYPTCSHQLAAHLDFAERAAIEAKHQAALAEMIADPAEPTTVPARKSYADLFRAQCMRLGCRNIQEDGSDYCPDDSLEDSF